MIDVSQRSNDARTDAAPWSPVIGLALMLLALALLVLSARPPAPKPITAPGNEFSAARAMAVLERLVGDGAPHPIGSEANARVGGRIDAELAALGYTVETQTTFACRVAWAVCGEVTNILSRLPGHTDGPAVLLSAHYDSISAGPGAADDMAGVAAILEVARIMRGEPPPRNPIIFLLSDGEEPGLLGAEAFVAEHPWRADVGVVVNLEANGTHGQSVLFETTEHNGWLVDTFVAAAPRPVVSSLADEFYAFLPFNTDLSVYEEAGIPGVNFAFNEEHPQYHTPLDRPANVDPGSVQHHGDNTLAAVRAFAARDLGDSPTGAVVYQDIVPGVVLRWPEPWTIWLALACAAAWLGVAVASIRRGELRARALLWGLPVLPVGLLGATLLGLALGMAVSSLAGAPAPWYANPLPMRVAVWAGALLCMGLIATAVARRAGFRGLFIGVWLWWSLLAVIVALLAPSASVLILFPTAIGALAAVAVAVAPFRRSARAWETAAMAALFGASWMWLWFSRGSDYSALGSDLGLMVGFAVSMAASALAPFIALPPEYGRVRRWTMVGLALLMVAATVVALRVPVYSALRPERLNLLHVQERQSEDAFWAIDGPTLPDGRAAAVPEELLRAGPFDGEMMKALPWSSREYLVASAPAAAMPGTVAVDVRAEEGAAGERVLRLALPPSRGGNRMSLYVPRSAGLRRIEVAGTPYTMEAVPIEDGYQRFLCIAPACDGSTLALTLEATTPFTMFVVEASPGLPESGEVLISARPDTAVPSGDGDTTLIFERVDVGAP